MSTLSLLSSSTEEGHVNQQYTQYLPGVLLKANIAPPETVDFSRFENALFMSSDYAQLIFFSISNSSSCGVNKKTWKKKPTVLKLGSSKPLVLNKSLMLKVCDKSGWFSYLWPPYTQNLLQEDSGFCLSLALLQFHYGGALSFVELL